MKTLHCIYFLTMLISCTTFATETPSFKKKFSSYKSSSNEADVLGYFRAHRQGRGISLNWGITSTEDLSYFEIERSYDGEYFSLLVQVPMNSSTRFSWKDDSADPGYIHYRIVCIMNDGSKIYSEVEVVRIVQRG